MHISTNDKTSTRSPSAQVVHGKAYTITNVLLAAMIALSAFAVYELHAYSGKMLLRTTEIRTAVIAREMLISGDYVTPTLGGEDQLKQPPLSYWLTSFSASTFFNGAKAGPHRLTRAVQFPPALSTALAIFAAVLFGSILFGRSAGIVAGLVLASTELTMRFAQLGFADATLMCLCTVAACGLTRVISSHGGIVTTLISGLALGLALLTKSPFTVLLLMLIPTGIELIFRSSTLTAKHYIFIVLALIVAAAVAAPWYMMFEQRHPGAVMDIFFNSQPGTSGNSGSPGSNAILKLFIVCLPWTPVAIMGLIALFSIERRFRKRPQPCDHHTRFFVLYLIGGILVLLILGKRQEQDLLPLIPALALLLGALVSRLNEPGGFSEERMAWSQIAYGLILALLICLPLLWPGISTQFNALGSEFAQRAVDFLTGLGTYAVLLAIGVLLLSHYCARQWVNGHGATVAIVFAGMALLATAWASLSAVENARHLELWASIDRVNDTLDSEHKDAVIFAPGVDESIVLFFTGRKPASIQRFKTEFKPGTGPVVFFVRGRSLNDFAAANKLNATGLPSESPSGFSIITLPETAPMVEELLKK